VARTKRGMKVMAVREEESVIASKRREVQLLA